MKAKPAKGQHTVSIQNNLPERWEIKPIGEACQFEKGKKPKNTGIRSDARTIPYINIKAFETGMSEEYAEPGNYPTCSKDDVLIVWDGARSGLIGKGVSGYIGSTLSKVWSELTNDKYLFYFLKSQYGYVNTNTKGVGIPHIDPNILYAIQLPLAPFNEQTLIVSEIEKQFSRLDEAVAALKRVRASLKRYKASVLKAAVEGKLTAEWRRLRIKGSPSKELSKVWSYSILGDISHKITDGEHLRPKTAHSGIPFLSARDIREHGVTFDNILYVQKDDAAKFRKRCNPERGDILVVSRGATVGRSCIVNTDRIFCLLGSVILIKSKGSILKKFLSYALKSSSIQKQLIALSGSTAQQAIYIRDIKKTVVPLPHLDEQQKIVEVIESRLSVAEEIEETIDIDLKRAERLRQAILKKAFSGRLVPQEALKLSGNS